MLKMTLEGSDQGGRLQGWNEEALVGHIDFVPAGEGLIDLTHTKVFPEFEGKGYGRQLVAAAVDYARAQHSKLKASCPYAAQVLSRKPEWSDVWGEGSFHPVDSRH